MSDKFVIAAQVSTGHSRPEALEQERVLSVLQQALSVAPLDILIVGWQEFPALYRVLTQQNTRPVRESFLWYPLLSDYPGLTPEHLVQDFRGRPSRGWGGFGQGGEINETFRFACPNNPDGRATTLYHLERLLTTYDFDGLFLDKFRFPSPANGLNEMLSCFCPHCHRAAAERGLDLDAVRNQLETPSATGQGAVERDWLPGAAWLADLLADRPILAEFVRFRLDSITCLVQAVHETTTRLGKKLALDLFTPGLAPLVGQDYASLAPLGAWAKPMIYRYAQGPASLRLELPALATDLGPFLGCESQTLLSWIQPRVPGLTGVDLDTVAREGAPLRLIADEARQAVTLLGTTPVYMGLETVSLRGVLDIQPCDVQEALTAAQTAGAAGVVLSWDLLHTPLENLEPLEKVL